MTLNEDFFLFHNLLLWVRSDGEKEEGVKKKIAAKAATKTTLKSN